MAGPYSYAERVANRAHAAAEHRSATPTPSQTATARPTTAPITRAEWNEIRLMERAIQSFEERFEEFMLNQSRLMEEFRVELDDLRAELDQLRNELSALRTTVKRHEARLLRLEAQTKDCDVSELSERMKSEGSAIRRAEDRIARVEANIAKHEALVERFSALTERFHALEGMIIEIREALAHRDSDGLASQVSAGDSVGTQESKPAEDELSAAGRTTDRWPALRVFFQALDQFGEDLNGFSMYEDESNSPERSS